MGATNDAGADFNASQVGPRYGLRVDVDWTVSRVEMADDEPGRSANLIREQIGCQWFDVVELDDKPGDELDMWVDDEGMFSAPVNGLASLIAARHGLTHQLYHGIALFTSRNGGATIGLGGEQLSRMEALAKQLMNVLGVGPGGVLVR
ncbi:DUF3846 domain-containing protein [Mycobacterium sp. NPDC003449]